MSKEAATMTPVPSVKGRVLQAIIDLQNGSRTPTRHAIAELTGLKLSSVDDNVKDLKDDSKIRTVLGGVFEVVDQFAANRPVSKTILSNGEVTVEVGDQCLQMTPGEARAVGIALHGDAMAVATIRGERQVYDTVASLRADLRAAQRKIVDMARTLTEVNARTQPDLFNEMG